jgi:hypothetical protein
MAGKKKKYHRKENAGVQHPAGGVTTSLTKVEGVCE